MAKKKKVSKGAKKRLLVFGTLSFAVIIYFFITLATYTLNIIDLAVRHLFNDFYELKFKQDNQEDQDGKGKSFVDYTSLLAQNPSDVNIAKLQITELQRQISVLKNDCENYKRQKYDDEIIALRESVKRASEKKMAEGTLSGTDLTRDIRAEQSARLDKIRHEIEWLLAVYNLKYVMNY